MGKILNVQDERLPIYATQAIGFLSGFYSQAEHGQAGLRRRLVGCAALRGDPVHHRRKNLRGQ